MYELFSHGGRVYLGGSFTTINELSRPGFAVVDAETGDLVAPNPKAQGIVVAMVPFNGVLYIAGVTSLYGQARGGGAAIDLSTGGLLPWAPGTTNLAAMAPAGGSMYIGGGFASVGGAPRNRLAAVDLVTGAVQPWHPTGPDKYVSTLAAVGNRLLVGGYFSVLDDKARSALGSYDTTTGALEAWAPNLSGPGVNDPRVYSIDVDGADALIAGEIGRVDQSTRRSVAKVNLSTGNVAAWDAALAGDSFANTAIVDAGRIVVGGNQGLTNAVPRAGTAAIDLSSGDLLPWKPQIPLPQGYVPRPTAVTVFDQTVYIAGTSVQLPNKIGPSFFVAVDALSGRMDPAFDPAYGGTAPLALKAGAGRVYVSLPTGVRALEAASGDIVWDASINGMVTQLDLDSPGQNLYLSSATDLLALQTSTGVLRPWKVTCDKDVRAVLWHNGAIYLGGDFKFVNGELRPFAAAVDVSDPDSPALLSWNPLSNGPVEALAVRAPVLLLGGTFGMVGNTPRARVAAVDLDGGWLYDWAPTVSAAVTRFAMGETTLAMRAGVYIEDLYAPGCDPRADCDGSGELDVDDFVCFQTAFGMGCTGY